MDTKKLNLGFLILTAVNGIVTIAACLVLGASLGKSCDAIPMVYFDSGSRKPLYCVVGDRKLHVEDSQCQKTLGGRYETVWVAPREH